jgi:carbon storage regulator CsrA
MLVLSRRREESVIVDGFSGPSRALRVTVLEIKGGCVRLGFEVNRNIPVHREEVWQQVLAAIPTIDSKGGLNNEIEN